MHFPSDTRMPIQNPGGYSEAMLDDERDTDLYDGHYFALHLRVDPAGAVEYVTLEDVQALANRIMATNHPGLVGHYTGGDSFAQWAEPYEGGDEDGRALHVLFAAPGLAAARVMGSEIAESVGFTSVFDATLSSGKDWAVQTELWPDQMPPSITRRASTDPATTFGVFTRFPGDPVSGEMRGLSSSEVLSALVGTFNNLEFTEIIIRPDH